MFTLEKIDWLFVDFDFKRFQQQQNTSYRWTTPIDIQIWFTTHLSVHFVHKSRNALFNGSLANGKRFRKTPHSTISKTVITKEKTITNYIYRRKSLQNTCSMRATVHYMYAMCANDFMYASRAQCNDLGSTDRISIYNFLMLSFIWFVGNE